MAISRRTFIERTLRQIYGGQPSQDANITEGLVNVWLSDAIATAAKANYIDSAKMDGIAYVNNGFYTTFKGLTVTRDEFALWKVILPQIPVGIGATEGIGTVVFKDKNNGEISYPVILMTENQRGFQRGRRDVPSKILAYPEGGNVFVQTTINLTDYTASVTMISGGDSTDLDSTLNVPPDYFPIMVEYIQKQLLLERAQPVDATNDGLDAKITT